MQESKAHKQCKAILITWPSIVTDEGWEECKDAAAASQQSAAFACYQKEKVFVFCLWLVGPEEPWVAAKKQARTNLFCNTNESPLASSIKRNFFYILPLISSASIRHQAEREGLDCSSVGLQEQGANAIMMYQNVPFIVPPGHINRTLLFSAVAYTEVYVTLLWATPTSTHVYSWNGKSNIYRNSHTDHVLGSTCYSIQMLWELSGQGPSEIPHALAFLWE